MSAPLGDDVLGDDPTVQALEARAAALAGKEAALFTPSGTMANLIAICVNTRPGDEVLLDTGAHPMNYEAAGASVVAGVQLRPLPTDRGLLDPAVVAAHIRPDNDHFAPATLLTVEDTSNRGGGTVSKWVEAGEAFPEGAEKFVTRVLTAQALFQRLPPAPESGS